MLVPVWAQNLVLRGQVADESGAVVPGADIVLRGSAGVVQSVKSSSEGTYTFSGLIPGDYTIEATASQLILREPVALHGSQTLNLVLQVVLEKQQVTVDEDSKPTVSTEASANASAVVLQGSDLEALSDNTDDLAAIFKPSPGLLPDRTGVRSSSTDSAGANFLRRTRSARSVSIRTPSRPSSIN